MKPFGGKRHRCRVYKAQVQCPLGGGRQLRGEFAAQQSDQVLAIRRVNAGEAPTETAVVAGVACLLRTCFFQQTLGEFLMIEQSVEQA